MNQKHEFRNYQNDIYKWCLTNAFESCVFKAWDLTENNLKKANIDQTDQKQIKLMFLFTKTKQKLLFVRIIRKFIVLWIWLNNFIRFPEILCAK